MHHTDKNFYSIHMQNGRISKNITIVKNKEESTLNNTLKKPSNLSTYFQIKGKQGKIY